MIVEMFDKYIIWKSIHVILQNFERYLTRIIGVSKSFERIFVNTVSTSLVPSYRVLWWHLYVAFTLKIFLCLSFFLYFSLIVSFVSSIWKSPKRFTPSSLLILQLEFISQEHVSRLMKHNNSEFPSKYSSKKKKNLQVCSSSMLILPLFSDLIKIHTNEIKKI